MALLDPPRPAPDFSLPDQHSRQRSLRDHRGRPVVLYFYPKDDTPGCTDQACQFRDLAEEFERLGAIVLGVSPDSASSHARFSDKFDLPFGLLADEAREGSPPRVCDAYGVWQEKSMYGKRYMGVARTTYLIDGEGRIARRWDGVKVPGHGREVLEALRGMVEPKA